jgi:hypothetical protein
MRESRSPCPCPERAALVASRQINSCPAPQLLRKIAEAHDGMTLCQHTEFTQSSPPSTRVNRHTLSGSDCGG